MKKLLKIIPVILVMCLILTSVWAVQVPMRDYETMDTLGEDVLSSSVKLVGQVAFTTVLLALVPTILLIIANWKIFSKAGKLGWACLIPIYGNVVQFQIVGLSPWLLLLYIVPIVNYVAIVVLTAVLAFRLAKSFGKDIGWGFGLWLLPFIFYLILGFGKSEYVGPNGEVKF